MWTRVLFGPICFRAIEEQHRPCKVLFGAEGTLFRVVRECFAICVESPQHDGHAHVDDDDDVHLARALRHRVYAAGWGGALYRGKGGGVGGVAIRALARTLFDQKRK